MSKSKIGFWPKLIGRILAGYNRKIFFSFPLELPLKVREQNCFFLIKINTIPLGFEFSISGVDLFQSNILLKSFQSEELIPAIYSALEEFSVPGISSLPIFQTSVQFQQELIEFQTKCRELRTEMIRLTASAISSLPLEKFQRPQIFSFLPRIVPIIKENIDLFCRLRVIKRPLLSSFLSKDEQLIFWKLAIRRSGKTVKNLTFGAIFYGVPVNRLENISYDPRRHLLFYTFCADPRSEFIRTRKVAAFIDNETQQVFFVNYD